MLVSWIRIVWGFFWKLPDCILKTRDDFLGEEPSRFIGIIAWSRSALGLALLAAIALTYPGFIKPTPELIPTGSNAPVVVVVTSKFANSWLTSLLYGLAIALLFFVLFALVIIAATRSPNRLAVLRHLCQPFIAFALFAALMAILVGTVDFQNWVLDLLDKPLSQAGHSPGIRQSREAGL